jgi:hypothetical protein
MIGPGGFDGWDYAGNGRLFNLESSRQSPHRHFLAAKPLLAGDRQAT